MPNLVETVRGYARHEGETLDEAQLRVGLDRLFAIAEAYPDLKASTNFQDL